MTLKDVKTLNYDEALKALELISNSLEKKEVSVDNLTEQVTLAKALVDHCKQKLNKTEHEIRKILDLKDSED